jgi:hypothetical protein
MNMEIAIIILLSVLIVIVAVKRIFKPIQGYIMDQVTNWVATLDGSIVTKMAAKDAIIADLTAKLDAANGLLETSVQTADVVAALSAENDKVNAM